MSDIKKFTKQIVSFRDARDWKQFHNPKDLSLSLMLEAGEVAEHFQWKTEKEIEAYIEKHRNEIADELIDTLYHVLLMAYDLHIDLHKAFIRKMAMNAKKYPVKTFKGKHK